MLQLWDVADGLHYLHSCNVIHGNLKAVSHLILHSQQSDINPNEPEGERSDRQGRSRPSHGLEHDVHHPGGALNY